MTSIQTTCTSELRTTTHVRVSKTTWECQSCAERSTTQQLRAAAARVGDDASQLAAHAE